MKELYNLDACYWYSGENPVSNNMFNNYMYMYYECSGIAVQSVWVNTLFHFLLLKKNQQCGYGKYIYLAFFLFLF